MTPDLLKTTAVPIASCPSSNPFLKLENKKDTHLTLEYPKLLRIQQRILYKLSQIGLLDQCGTILQLPKFQIKPLNCSSLTKLKEFISSKITVYDDKGSKVCEMSQVEYYKENLKILQNLGIELEEVFLQGDTATYILEPWKQFGFLVKLYLKEKGIPLSFIEEDLFLLEEQASLPPKNVKLIYIPKEELSVENLTALRQQQLLFLQKKSQKNLFYIQEHCLMELLIPKNPENPSETSIKNRFLLVTLGDKSGKRDDVKTTCIIGKPECLAYFTRDTLSIPCKNILEGNGGPQFFPKKTPNFAQAIVDYNLQLLRWENYDSEDQKAFALMSAHLSRGETLVETIPFEKLVQQTYEEDFLLKLNNCLTDGYDFDPLALLFQASIGLNWIDPLFEVENLWEKFRYLPTKKLDSNDLILRNTELSHPLLQEIFRLISDQEATFQEVLAVLFMGAWIRINCYEKASDFSFSVEEIPDEEKLLLLIKLKTTVIRLQLQPEQACKVLLNKQQPEKLNPLFNLIIGEGLHFHSRSAFTVYFEKYCLDEAGHFQKIWKELWQNLLFSNNPFLMCVGQKVALATQRLFREPYVLKEVFETLLKMADEESKDWNHELSHLSASLIPEATLWAKDSKSDTLFCFTVLFFQRDLKKYAKMTWNYLLATTSSKEQQIVISRFIRQMVKKDPNFCLSLFEKNFDSLEDRDQIDFLEQLSTQIPLSENFLDLAAKVIESTKTSEEKSKFLVLSAQASKKGFFDQAEQLLLLLDKHLLNRTNLKKVCIEHVESVANHHLGGSLRAFKAYKILKEKIDIEDPSLNPVLTRMLKSQQLIEFCSEKNEDLSPLITGLLPLEQIKVLQGTIASSLSKKQIEELYASSFKKLFEAAAIEEISSILPIIEIDKCELHKIESILLNFFNAKLSLQITLKDYQQLLNLAKLDKLQKLMPTLYLQVLIRLADKWRSLPGNSSRGSLILSEKETLFLEIIKIMVGLGKWDEKSASTFLNLLNEGGTTGKGKLAFELGSLLTPCQLTIFNVLSLDKKIEFLSFLEIHSMAPLPEMEPSVAQAIEEKMASETSFQALFSTCLAVFKSGRIKNVNVKTDLLLLFLEKFQQEATSSLVEACLKELKTTLPKLDSFKNSFCLRIVELLQNNPEKALRFALTLDTFDKHITLKLCLHTFNQLSLELPAANLDRFLIDFAHLFKNHQGRLTLLAPAMERLLVENFDYSHILTLVKKLGYVKGAFLKSLISAIREQAFEPKKQQRAKNLIFETLLELSNANELILTPEDEKYCFMEGLAALAESNPEKCMKLVQDRAWIENLGNKPFIKELVYVLLQKNIQTCTDPLKHKDKIRSLYSLRSSIDKDHEAEIDICFIDLFSRTKDRNLLILAFFITKTISLESDDIRVQQHLLNALTNLLIYLPELPQKEQPALVALCDKLDKTFGDQIPVSIYFEALCRQKNFSTILQALELLDEVKNPSKESVIELLDKLLASDTDFTLGKRLFNILNDPTFHSKLSTKELDQFWSRYLLNLLMYAQSHKTYGNLKLALETLVTYQHHLFSLEYKEFQKILETAQSTLVLLNEPDPEVSLEPIDLQKTYQTWYKEICTIFESKFKKLSLIDRSEKISHFTYQLATSLIKAPLSPLVKKKILPQISEILSAALKNGAPLPSELVNAYLEFSFLTISLTEEDPTARYLDEAVRLYGLFKAQIFSKKSGQFQDERLQIRLIIKVILPYLLDRPAKVICLNGNLKFIQRMASLGTPLSLLLTIRIIDQNSENLTDFPKYFFVVSEAFEKHPEFFSWKKGSLLEVIELSLINRDNVDANLLEALIAKKTFSSAVLSLQHFKASQRVFINTTQAIKKSKERAAYIRNTQGDHFKNYFDCLCLVVEKHPEYLTLENSLLLREVRNVYSRLTEYNPIALKNLLERTTLASFIFGIIYVQIAQQKFVQLKNSSEKFKDTEAGTYFLPLLKKIKSKDFFKLNSCLLKELATAVKETPFSRDDIFHFIIMSILEIKDSNSSSAAIAFLAECHPFLTDSIRPYLYILKFFTNNPALILTQGEKQDSPISSFFDQIVIKYAKKNLKDKAKLLLLDISKNCPTLLKSVDPQIIMPALKELLFSFLNMKILSNKVFFANVKDLMPSLLDYIAAEKFSPEKDFVLQLIEESPKTNAMSKQESRIIWAHQILTLRTSEADAYVEKIFPIDKTRD